MPYKNKIVTALDELVKTYGGDIKDPMFKILWMSIRGQVPTTLAALDNNPEAIAKIEAKVKEIFELDKLPDELVAELNAAVKRHKNGTITIKLPDETWKKVLPQYFTKVPIGAASATIELSPLDDND